MKNRDLYNAADTVYVVTCGACGKSAAIIGKGAVAVKDSLKEAECYACGSKALKLENGVRTYMDKDGIRIESNRALK